MIRIAPVRKQLVVKASQARAFAVFTGEMSRWWPATHSILKSPLKESIVEPRVAAVGTQSERTAPRAKQGM